MNCEHCDNTLDNPTGKMLISVFHKGVSEKYYAKDAVDSYDYPFNLLLHLGCEQGVMVKCKHTDRDQSFVSQSILLDDQVLESWDLCEWCASNAFGIWEIL